MLAENVDGIRKAFDGGMAHDRGVAMQAAAMQAAAVQAGDAMKMLQPGSAKDVAINISDDDDGFASDNSFVDTLERINDADADAGGGAGSSTGTKEDWMLFDDDDEV